MVRERIIPVLLAAALLAVPIQLARDEMDTETIRKNRYWVRKTQDPETYPVVFGGDSRVFRGISPGDFSREFHGIESFNYAYWSNGYGQIYLEGLEAKVDTASHRKMIILGITPWSLTEKGARSEHYRFERNKKRESILQILYFSRIQEIFTPYRVHDLAQMIAGKKKPDNYRIIYHRNGWVESWWLDPDTTHAARFYKDIFEGNPVSESVIEGLLDQVDRWTEMGIRVVGFRPPSASSIRAFERTQGGFDEDEFSERFRQAGGVWIDVDPHAFRTYDGSHLEHESARQLSARLGRELADLFPE